MFLIGTALDFRTANELKAEELDFIKAQFNAITPENSMKPDPVHPQDNSWNWAQPEVGSHRACDPVGPLPIWDFREADGF